MRSARTHRGASQGFTMLELIAASAIAAVLFMIVFQIVWSTIRLREYIEEAALPYAAGPAVMDRLTQDLRHAMTWPYNEGDTFRAERENVNGEDVTKLLFVASVSSRRKFEIDREEVRAYVNEIGWRCRRSEARDGLLTLYRREDPGVDEDPFDDGKYAKVVDGVKAFHLDFFANDPGSPDDEAADGEEEWDAKKEEGLPWGCRITLELVPDYELDEDGNPISGAEATTYLFQSFVAFPSRFERPKTRATPSTGPAPSGN